MWYPSPIHQYFDSNGDMLTGGLLYTYEAGTSTPKATYSDVSLETENDNPIVLDSRGECGPIFGFGFYKYVLKSSDGEEIWSADNIWGIGCCSTVTTFTDADLDANNDLTIAHSYGAANLHVTVYDESDIRIEPEYIDCSSASQIVIGFGALTLTGTWTVRYGL